MGGVYDQNDRDREKELQDIRDQYLGNKKKKKKLVKPSEKFAQVFKFDWEATDDTASHDVNPIYAQRMGINPLFGRGYIAGLDMQEQRKNNAFNKTLVDKRQAEERRLEQLDDSLSQKELAARERARREVSNHLRADEVSCSSSTDGWKTEKGTSAINPSIPSVNSGISASIGLLFRIIADAVD